MEKGIDFMVDAINVYLNEWLQITLPNDCTQLCAKVDPAHNSTCNLMCNAYGLYEFIKVISKVDIDPIYMCQLQKQCPIQDCATPSCAEIVSINLKPQPVKRGDTLTVTGIYRVSGNAGAGMLRLMSETQAGTKTLFLLSSSSFNALLLVFTLKYFLHLNHHVVHFGR
jgi:hypothetical protein